MVVLPELALLFDGVTKTFADKAAVADLSFQVPRGSIYGLLGPNGAGKTTSIRMLMSILQPDDGRIRVFGTEPSAASKDRIGYLPEERGLYPTMTVIDNLVFFGSIRGLSPPEARHRAQEWLRRFGLDRDAGRKLVELSKGNQQKIQFLSTVLHEPDLLVLDEPFSGLDPVNQDLMRHTILETAAAGTTVVLSTHLMDEVERLCSHLTLIHRGRAILDGKLDDVREKYGSGAIRIDAEGDPETIASHPAVLRAARAGRSLEVTLAEGVEPSDFLASIAGICRIRRFEVATPSLHDLFVRLVGEDRDEAEAPAGRVEAARSAEIVS